MGTVTSQRLSRSDDLIEQSRRVTRGLCHCLFHPAKILDWSKEPEHFTLSTCHTEWFFPWDL
jgi:hypothetical protein